MASIFKSSDLFWDNTNKQLGIGTTGALTAIAGRTYLSIKGKSSALGGVLQLQSYDGGAVSAHMGNIEFIDPSNTSSASFRSAYITSVIEGSTASNRGAYLAFGTKQDGSSSGGVERIRIDNTGNVGIGTSAPATKLHVNAGRSLFAANSETYSVAVKYNNTTGEFYMGASNSATPDLIFSQVGGSERMRVTNAGNVGVGTVPPANSVSILHASADLTLEGASRGFLGNLYYNSSLLQWKYAGTGYGWGWMDSGSGNITFQSTSSSGTAGATATPSERMRIDAAGNFGIGTTATISTARLYLAGGSGSTLPATSGTTQSSGHIARFKDGSNAILEIGGASSAGYWIQVTDQTNLATNYPLILQPNSGSNVYVAGTTNVNNSRFAVHYVGSSTGGMGVNDSSSTNASVFVGFTTGGTFRGSITNNNNTAVAYNTTSDYRLKTNVQPMINAIEKIKQLNPVTFTWVDQNIPGQGFIAHELQNVFPDAVTGEKDEVDSDGKPKYQGVDTKFLVATLVKAIQEISTRLDSAGI